MPLLYDKITEIRDGDFNGLEVLNPRDENGKSAIGHFQYRYGTTQWEHYPVQVSINPIREMLIIELWSDGKIGVSQSFRGTVVGKITYDPHTGILKCLFHDNFPPQITGYGTKSPQQQLIDELKANF